MNTRHCYKVFEYDLLAGTTIDEAAEELCQIAKQDPDSVIRSSFNGFKIEVYAFTKPDEIVKEYDRWRLSRNKKDKVLIRAKCQIYENGNEYLRKGCQEHTVEERIDFPNCTWKKIFGCDGRGNLYPFEVIKEVKK